jgi:hypothetical protein
MKKIDKDELFGNLKDFLKSKGIELQEGSYAHRIRLGTDMLTDSINVGQAAFGRAKEAVGQGLDQLRQSIHEHTAPKGTPPENQPGGNSNPPEDPKPAEPTASAKRPPRAKAKRSAKKKN